MDGLDAFIARLNLPIRDRTLLARALTHSSWLHEHPGGATGHNERLEFLGDAVISLIVSRELYRRHPDDDEGVLSSRRAAIVSTAGLATISMRARIGDDLRLGEGEATRGGRVRPSVLASALEAVVGALFLDLGWSEVDAWFRTIAATELDASLGTSALKSPKSRLQEWTQRQTGERPAYRVVEAAGPDHERLFRVEVVVDGKPVGSGLGPSRRVAETNAAAEALQGLSRSDDGAGEGE